MTIRTNGQIIGGNISEDLLSTKANINLDNSTAITNCITEIPQDIKLELNDDTLTLKAGSKVYMPNGSGVFNTITVPQDWNWTPNSSDVIVFTDGNGTQDVLLRDYCFSGSSAPTSFQGGLYALWYDTTNNAVKKTNDGGATWIGGYGLPVYALDADNSYQVFNGFGYIGSTVFALPGVKGLIPNGRNTDGTLKNTEFTISQVQTFSITSEWGTGVEEWWLNGINMDIHRAIRATYFQDSKPSTPYQDAYWFSPKENILRQTTDTGATWTQIQGSYGFNISFTSGKVTSLTPKTAFRALDYNDSSTISGWAMPSNRYISLTLGASGSTYTAPANGYFILYAQYASGTDTCFDIYNYSNAMGYRHWYGSNSALSAGRGFVPVQKGDILTVVINGTLQAVDFRFVYAEGENV